MPMKYSFPRQTFSAWQALGLALQVAASVQAAWSPYRTVSAAGMATRQAVSPVVSAVATALLQALLIAVNAVHFSTPLNYAGTAEIGRLDAGNARGRHHAL